MFYYKPTVIELSANLIYIRLNIKQQNIQLLSHNPNVPSWILFKEDETLSFAKDLSKRTGFYIQDNRD
jgi:dolichyl-phosphate-mannose--protein O-mannosyl transferase